MNTPLDTAYFSAVMVAGALEKDHNPLAADARALKEAIARALTHPEAMRTDEFKTIWNGRTRFSTLNLDGETGDVITKHATILTQITLN